MALPKKPQMIKRQQAVAGLTNEQMAVFTEDKSVNRYRKLANGYAYVSPSEAIAFSKLFNDLPVQTLFDEGALAYIAGPWPIPRGAGSLREKLDRAEAELAHLRGTREGDSPRAMIAPVGLTEKVTVIAVPDEYAERVVAYLRSLDAS